MYYRRKLLLALLQMFDNSLERISLQKLLLIFSEKQTKPDFHFVPYRKGCYSFQANADLNTMIKYNQVMEVDKVWHKIDTIDYIIDLKDADRKLLRLIKNQHSGKSKDELIRYTYLQYPYYALNSSIVHKVLTDSEYEVVEGFRPTQESTLLFTIGYEGVTLEQYLNKLIINNIKVLCDVRKNPLSMKYGFNKNQLKTACEGVGITYIHIPELGIESDMRQEINTQQDYDKLFMRYRNEILQETHSQQEFIIELVKSNKRVALTCFEANICQCHRKHLAEAIKHHPDFTYELKHI